MTNEMGIRIGDGGEELKTLGKADDVTVINLGNQKPPLMSSSSPPPSISSTNESMIDPVKASYGRISQSNGEEEEEFDWVAVDREADVVITDKAPEIEEVEDAFSALQL